MNSAGAAPAAQPATASQTKRPRLHLIYFALAAFDLIAILGGLYLSHQLRTVFEQSMATNHEWNGRFASIWNLGDLAAKVNAPGNDVFESGDVDGERSAMRKAARDMEAAIDKVRAEIIVNAPSGLASHPVRALTYVEQSLRIMVGHGEKTLDLFAAGDNRNATIAMARMDRSFYTLKQQLNGANSAIAQIQAAFGKGYGARVESLKRYELLIGGAIIVMVSCVLVYGHFVGRFMTRKYRELEVMKAAAERSEEEARGAAVDLQLVNGEIAGLNRDLQDNLTKLREAQDKIVRKGKLSQLGQLTATVAHEQRNPLGAVRTSAFILERKSKDQNLGFEVQLTRINNGVRRCDDIISQLLDFARAKNLHLEAVVLDDWLARLVEEESQALPAPVSVECHLNSGSQAVAIDLGRMTRVLINLLNNASEAMIGKGDDPAKFTTAEPRIVIHSRLTARGMEVSVTDNGPGINEETQAKILEPLFTTKSFGTGLGLPATQKILEQHGGGLDIRSAPGMGATFTAWWPANARPEQLVA